MTDALRFAGELLFVEGLFGTLSFPLAFTVFFFVLLLPFFLAAPVVEEIAFNVFCLTPQQLTQKRSSAFIGFAIELRQS